MALIRSLLFLSTFVLCSHSHTVYYEGKNPQKINRANTTYSIKQGEPGIVITNFGNEVIQFIQDTPPNEGIALSIATSRYFKTPVTPASFQNCKVCSLPGNACKTTLYDILIYGPSGTSCHTFNSSISIQCTNANDTDYMLVIQPKKNADYLGYQVMASVVPPTDFYTDSQYVFTTVSLQPAVPYIRSLKFRSGSKIQIADSTPQKVPGWTLSTNTIDSIIPTNNYLFTTYFIEANATMEVSPHLTVCSGKRTITQADMDPNGVFTFPAVRLNGGYDCSYQIIPPNTKYYTKIVMNGFLTNSFYLNLYYEKEFARTFTVEGTNLLTGTYYFPNGGFLEFDSGNDGDADIGFTISFVKMSVSPYVDRQFLNNGELSLSEFVGNIEMFSPTDRITQSLSLLTVNENPTSLTTITSLDYCFLTVMDSGSMERYSLREFTVFKTPILFTSAFFQCAQAPQHQGKIIVVIGNRTDWLPVCQMTASYSSYLTQVKFPLNPACNGFNYLVQVQDTNRTTSVITRIDNNSRADVLVFRGVITGTYVGSVSNRTLPFKSSFKYVSYAAVTTSDITLYWDSNAYMESTTELVPVSTSTPRIRLHTTPYMETTTKASPIFQLMITILILVCLK